MERAQIVDIPAERLVAGYQRARKLWGPFHVVWVDMEGRVHWAEPDWCDTAEVLAGTIRRLGRPGAA